MQKKNRHRKADRMIRKEALTKDRYGKADGTRKETQTRIGTGREAGWYEKQKYNEGIGY